MDSLPGHLLDKVLFKTDLRALANLCFTNKSLQSHIQNPSFVSEYYSQMRSSLLHISSYGSPYLTYHPHDGSRSLMKTKDILTKCLILGYCSGLLLLYIDDRLCVTNPITKKFRFLTLSDHMRHSNPWNMRKQAGLAVNQIDRTTQSFKAVYMFRKITRYGFEINSGDSWTRSKTTLTCNTSDLDDRMKNPVYLDGSLHWLRSDGSIVSFNPETEEARLIQVEFPHGLSSKTLFASGGDGALTLVSANEEVIYVYALKNILSDPKWVLVEQIQNGVIDKNGVRWCVEAYNGKRLVLRGDRVNIVEKCYDRLVHVYDLIDNKWLFMGSVPTWCDATRDFFLFTPSSSFVVGLKETLACGDGSISSLRLIMGLVDGTSSEKVKSNLGWRKKSR